MTIEFWQTSGFDLLEPTGEGMLGVTPDFLRAYFSRPEIAPIEDSCEVEIALFEELVSNPEMQVSEQRLAQIADRDTADNYRFMLRFRDHLAEHRTLESAYMALVTSNNINVPPVFIDQMTHAILRNVLSKNRDPIRLRAAEIFFRDQNVSLDDGRIMLADDEIVEMYGENGSAGGLGQLLTQSGTLMRSVELDVLDEDNKDQYWQRSNQFDMVVDFRYTQPALDAFCRVIEAWINHFLKVEVRVQPREKLHDEHWTWHVGLDAEATRILNGLYDGVALGIEDIAQIIALFRLDFADQRIVIPEARGKPVYLALAVNKANKLKMKPQNLLVNLPIAKDL
jgi:Family of unknown function (DUF6352)